MQGRRWTGGLWLALIVAVAALLGATWAHLNSWLPYQYIWWVPAFSLATFVVYGVDKAAAQRSWRRVPEAHLHVLSLFGGWPGALVAQQLMRHKTRKQPFRGLFWLTVVANLVGVWWFFVRTAEYGGRIVFW